MSKATAITVYLPDTRGVKLSRYGIGNNKLGLGVFTYSRLPGLPSRPALGILGDGLREDGSIGWAGTCPGATPECQAICYARRPVMELGPVALMWLSNSTCDDVPPIPAECQVLRLHVSGDFNSVKYIENWIARLAERPDVTAWAYTRSWRVPELLPALERLRTLPNVQMFASMDPSCEEMPPAGPPCTCRMVVEGEAHERSCPRSAWRPWRRAWIWRERPTDRGPAETRLEWVGVISTDEVLRKRVFEGFSGTTLYSGDLQACTVDGVPSYVCPEETGRKKNCLECGYCFEGQKNDVTFLEH